MGILDEIKRMRQEGRNEQEISQILQQEGISAQEIDNALSQTQIKEAIVSPLPEPNLPMELPVPEPDYQTNEDALQSSLMSSPEMEQAPQETPLPAAPQPFPEENISQPYPESYPEAQYPQQDYGYDYQQYAQAPQQSVSADTITEIAEQVVSEKLSKIRNQLEKTSDLKTTVEARVAAIDDRLQRIEKIIDRLQLSILQKIGDYVNDVSDLRKELFETQKSFKALSPKQDKVRHMHSKHLQHKR